MEKRHFTRIPFDATIQLGLDQTSYEVNLLDVSLNGALIEKPANFQGNVNDQVNLDLILNDDSSTIKMVGAIAHLSADRIGIKSTQMDIESVTHLRRLVELNSDDADLLNRELGALHP